MNKTLFKNPIKNAGLKSTDTKNAAGGIAYSFTDEATLAQMVVTSCFNNTAYLSAEEQLDKILDVSSRCSTLFVAKIAVYAHEVAGMKDTAALMLAVLTTRGEEGGRLAEAIAPRVLTNFKMVANFITAMRSGVVGRRSLGSAPKRIVRRWLASRSGNALFTGSIGANPSFADVIRMVHPKPENAEKEAFYAYMIGKPYASFKLPTKVQQFENFKATLGRSAWFLPEMVAPDVPFQMLSSLPLAEPHWKHIARNMPWNATRQNLNTFARHGVFNDDEMVKVVADKLANADEVRRAKAMPAGLLAAYLNTTGVPNAIRNALQDAMEVATENVPAFSQDIAICVDTSGSMETASITGSRKGSTSVIKAVQAAALFASALARKNSNALVLPFDTAVHDAKSINPRDSVMTNTQKLARFGGGGTDCSAPIRVLNSLVGKRPEVVIVISDNESWFNSNTYEQRMQQYVHYYRLRGMNFHPTAMADEWATYKKKTPKAKLVLINLTPDANSQVYDQDSVLNIGGFNDKIWPIIEAFVNYGHVNMVDVINSVELG